MNERTTGDFGARLRAAREKRGISVKQIANATKISNAALEALERNDISKLPGGIFSRAFVRSYAAEVGLDPEETIREFVAQFPTDSVTVGHAPSRPIEDNEVVESDRRIASTVVKLAAVSLPIVALAIYFSATEPAVSPTETVENRPVAASAPSDAPQPVAAGDSLTERVPTVSATGGTQAPAEKTRAAKAPTAGPKPVTPSTDRLSVALEVNAPTWISFSIDGDPPVQRQLQAGARELFEVRRDLVLSTGDAGALSLTINGAAAKPLGKAGESATTRLNLTNYRTYLAP